MDIETSECYLLGTYIYSIYKQKMGSLDINDPVTFCFILGYYLKSIYPPDVLFFH